MNSTFGFQAAYLCTKSLYAFMTKQFLQGKFKRLNFIAFISSIIGITLLLLSVQIHSIWNQLNKGYESYVVINKPVNILSTFGFPANFLESEIKELESKTYIKQVGAFQSNDFRVSLGSNRLGFRTEAFFESVPDEFIDINISNWENYQLGDVVPIILSSDYLALYNFGFAPSQGLPQFTPSTISKVNLDLSIQGNGNYSNLKGKIVGFSSRINSIIVPEIFLVDANKKYGNSANQSISRLILEVDHPDARPLIEFCKEKGYELNIKKAFGEEFSKLIQKGILLIVIIGLLVMILTILIFYLTYRLIIEERMNDFRILFTQGYTSRSLAQPFERYFIKMAVGSLLISVLINYIILFFISKKVNELGFDISSYLSLNTWIFTIVIGIVLIIGSRYLIRTSLEQKYL